MKFPEHSMFFPELLRLSFSPKLQEKLNHGIFEWQRKTETKIFKIETLISLWFPNLLHLFTKQRDFPTLWNRNNRTKIREIPIFFPLVLAKTNKTTETKV